MNVEKLLRSTISEKTFTILFELLLWLNPVKSLFFVTGVHIGLFLLYSVLSKGLLFLFSFFFLFQLWTPIWTQKIWPSIQLPEFARLDDWLTLDPSIPPYDETISIFAKFIVNCCAPLKNLYELRDSDPAKYIIYSSSGCLLLVLIGQKISGFILSYIIVLAFFLIPLILKTTIFEIIDGKSESVEASPPIENTKATEETPVEETPVAEDVTPLVETTDISQTILTSEAILNRELSMREEYESESASGYTESDEEPPRRESVFDPLAEPTWMEDFGRNISDTNLNTKTGGVTETIVQEEPNVTSQIEEAIGMSLKEKESSGSESTDSDKSDFVLLSTEDAKKK